MPDLSSRYFGARTEDAPEFDREPGGFRSTSFTTTDLPDSSVSKEPVPVEPIFPDNQEIFAQADDSFFPETDEGRIVVRAQTALGSLPVSEAAVIVSGTRGGVSRIVSFQLTDKSGRTPEFSVPAPPKADSQTPSESLPFSDYDITVRHPMYYTSVIKDVQVFGDELTILTAELTPLPELVNETNITNTVDIPRQNL